MTAHLRSTILSLLVGLALIGCGDTEAPVGVDVSRAEVSVCGEGGVGFAAHRQSYCCGLLDVGDTLALELGQFVTVDTDCRFVVSEAHDGSLGTAFGGHLTPEQAEELSQTLALHELADLAPQYAIESNLPLATNRFAWGSHRIEVVGVAPEDLPDDLSARLNQLASDSASLLKSWGTPIRGPVRYMVTGGPMPASGQAEASTIQWPLAIPLEELALPAQGDGSPRLWLATGDDAAALKVLRAAWLEERGNRNVTRQISITQSNGQTFTITMRDVVEFEVDASTFVPWATGGSLTINASSPPSTSEVAFEVTCRSASEPVAQGLLEPLIAHAAGILWQRRIDGLPPGDCDVHLTPTDPDDTLRCDSNEGGEADNASVTIPTGWNATRSFRCPQ